MSNKLLPTEIVNLYRIWISIIYRCTRPENKQYKNYGGRGINICKEWMNFNVFCNDVGPRPFQGCHLDRIDNDKGYFKENCRWTTPKINHRNKRNNRFYITHLGRICQSELIEKMNYTRKQFQRAVEKYGEEHLLLLFKNNNLPKKRAIPNLEDCIGEKIGSLKILEMYDKKNGVRYTYQCDCGRKGRISRYKVMHKLTTRCLSCARKNNKNATKK